MCFLTLPVFACVIHYLWLGREIAQCNWSESRYGIILSLVFRVFTTFTITIISEVMKHKEKLSINYYRSDVVKFYTSIVMFMLKKKNARKKKRKEGKKLERLLNPTL